MNRKIFITFFLVCIPLTVLAQERYYVIEEETLLCGEFIRGNREVPNWLPYGWEAVFLRDDIQTSFEGIQSCINGNTEICCKSNGFRYAGIPIGIPEIELERRSAEFLASKGVIAKKSFNPHEYKLYDTITRKEVMKVIMKISGEEINGSCDNSFIDVENDWGCKYISSAFSYEYLSPNEYFRPHDSLTKLEAIKLIFKARKIEKSYDTGDWAQDYLSTALYLGYINEKPENHNDYILRGDFFKIVAKTYSEF